MVLIKNAKLCCASRADTSRESAFWHGYDILIDNGKIAEISKIIPITPQMKVVNADNLIAAPGLVDMHVHFREPGYEYKEDIHSGAKAAAAGGITTCLCMANTNPAADNPHIVGHILSRAKDAQINVLTSAAVTVGLSGSELTDFTALKKAGATALSDDGNSVQNAALMRLALQDALTHDLLVISHCEDSDIAGNNGVNEGAVSEKLNIPGRPAIAEEIMVARDIMLAAETGARIHIAHVSTRNTVEIIRKAKKAGVKVTAETAPHYFSLTEDEILRQGAAARVNPPLRTEDDRNAIVQGLMDNTIDAIATDHAPHSTEEKSGSLVNAMSGVIGLETSFALALTFLHHTGMLEISEIIKLMSVNPAAILGLSAGKLEVGAVADIILFDPHEKWIVEPDRFISKARNTLFGGMELQGRVKYTISRGKIVYDS